VLVVDDEAGDAHGLRRALRGFAEQPDETGMVVGFRVDEADSGEQANEMIQEAPPDIILLVHRMGGSPVWTC
jgi:CheY-like chemotaxis protein